MTTSSVGPTEINPYALPATTHSYLLRAAESLSEAIATGDVATRYACAHVAALRAAAALLAARARPAPARRRPQKNAWVLLAEVAPELGEWASFFAAGAGKRAAAEAGSSGRSPSGRPTTSCATPTASSGWWSPPSDSYRTHPCVSTWSAVRPDRRPAGLRAPR